jgi:hypothetical protein
VVLLGDFSDFIKNFAASIIRRADIGKPGARKAESSAGTCAEKWDIVLSSRRK